MLAQQAKTVSAVGEVKKQYYVFLRAALQAMVHAHPDWEKGELLHAACIIAHKMMQDYQQPDA